MVPFGTGFGRAEIFSLVLYIIEPDTAVTINMGLYKRDALSKVLNDFLQIATGTGQQCASKGGCTKERYL